MAHLPHNPDFPENVAGSEDEDEEVDAERAEEGGELTETWVDGGEDSFAAMSAGIWVNVIPSKWFRFVCLRSIRAR